MKRQSVILCALLIGMLLLCGCGAVNTESDSGKTENLPAAAETVLPAAGAEPTPIPVPEYTFPDGSVHRADETVLDLSSLTHRDVETVAALLREMPDLQEIELGTDGAWTGTQPELTEDMTRLMNYYLPTMVKLLHSYADLDSQGKSSANIEKSKREIEDTIDVMNEAFDRLFDSLFEDTSLDISTDVEVMRTLLSQEGLTGHSFGSNQTLPGW